jgi:1,4-dihydroxy-6-naphthoate synthase
VPAGAALGRGCGPLVVVRDEASAAGLEELAGKKVAVPGMATTAHLLLRRFAPTSAIALPMRFDRIMPAVARGEVDAGVIIHEGRFTYREHGLVQIADLGELWESETDLPLPLGVICARRDLDERVYRSFARALRASIEYAFADPLASRDYVSALAQELEPEVCRRHIELYVNEYSLELASQGEAAIVRLLGPQGVCSADLWR